MKRITQWKPAFDRRSDDPNKDQGIHGMELRFVLSGDAGAVQFLLMTSWCTSAVRAEKRWNTGPHLVPACLLAPLPADLGYHSPHLMYEGHKHSEDACPYLDGKPCYYGGSTMNATQAFDAFTDGGEEALWEFLERYYRRTFETAEGLLKTSS